MAENINRVIQFKRNTTPSISAAEVKQRIMGMESQLANGEFIIGSYMDVNSNNGSIADVIGIKAQNKMFFIDNQTILNKIGIKGDGSETSPSVPGTIIYRIEQLESGSTDLRELIERVIASDGINADGTYTDKATDRILSGANSLFNADEKLSDEIQAVEDFVGMGDGSGDSLVDRIAALSGKAITQVEDTATIDFTKEPADDGTQKIHADVKLSSEVGNILLAKTDGIYTNVSYNSLTNELIINGSGTPLNAGSIIDRIYYDTATEELVVVYHTTTSSGEVEVRVPMAGLIDEYVFGPKDDLHNVGFEVTRNFDQDGHTKVQADVSLIDCGEY